MIKMKSEGPQQERSASADDKNVMPSMVVRQQRIQMQSSSAMNNNRTTTTAQNHHHHHLQQARPSLSTTAIPSATSTSSTASLIKAAKEQLNGQHGHQQQLEFDQDGLVLPKRVLHHHPPGSVAQPIIRDLNRELKFNQVRGKNVLDQKSELKKAMEKLEVNKRKKEAEQERLNRRTSLELRLEERAERIAKEEEITSGSTITPTTTTTSAAVLSTGTTAATNTTTSTSTSSSTKANNNNNNNNLKATCNSQNPLGTFSIKSMTR